jgi:hypothetical protein
MHWWVRHNKVRRAGKTMPNPNADKAEASADDE